MSNNKSICVLLLLVFYMTLIATPTLSIRLLLKEEIGKQEAKVRNFEVDEIDGNEGLIYNVDYHGIATHPSPVVLPKHPKP